MTIKAQGHSTFLVFFSHGQLYVAFSRIEQLSSIKILLHRNTSTTKNYTGSYTDNIVFHEVFI
ncbi:hypothetical protein BD408DRAFT_415075 [Parasitella parasitica]|nr:hypothetical protein BD408DRAFT_415075 [Parasitella parasitica]